VRRCGQTIIHACRSFACNVRLPKGGRKGHQEGARTDAPASCRTAGRQPPVGLLFTRTEAAKAHHLCELAADLLALTGLLALLALLGPLGDPALLLLGPPGLLDPSDLAQTGVKVVRLGRRGLGGRCPERGDLCPDLVERRSGGLRRLAESPQVCKERAV
jgi:hypothetical protein